MMSCPPLNRNYLSEDFCLLITGCINPTSNQKYLILTDPEERLRQYVDSILYYFEASPFSKIVFCENSNYKTDKRSELLSIAQRYNIRFEWISFEGDKNLVEKYQKGAGEDEIIDHALADSKILKDTKSFVKVTGRLKLLNIGKLLKDVSLGKNYFLRDVYRPHMHGVDTRFYVCDISYYNSKLRNCYKCGKVNKLVLEDLYYMILNGDYCVLNSFFRIEGVSGGNGRDYSKEPYILLKFFDVLCYLKIFNKFFIFAYGAQLLRRGYLKMISYSYCQKSC